MEISGIFTAGLEDLVKRFLIITIDMMKRHDLLALAGTLALAYTSCRLLRRCVIWTLRRLCARGTIDICSLPTSLRLAVGRGSKHRSDELNRVIFYPDFDLICWNFIRSPDGCSEKELCPLSHEPAVSELSKYLESARESVDVCVFIITFQPLSDILVKQHGRMVKVRVISDANSEDAKGSQIPVLRSKGVRVRTNKSSYLMHHKFVLIDGKILVNGSFNWTAQAVSGNHENCLITNNPTLVRDFKNHFESLWEEFRPQSERDREASQQMN